MGSRRVLSFEVLSAVLLFALIGVVAARSGSVHDHPRPHGHHTGVRSQQKVPVLNLGDGLDQPIYVEVGTKFQLAILESGSGEVLYLYSEGEKVLKTSDPDSVGTARTIWEAVEDISPRSLDYQYAFAIQNTDTEAVLVYDGEFRGTWSKPVIAGWRLFQTPLTIDPPQYLLRYVPYSSNGFIPGIYYYQPLLKHNSHSSSLGRGDDDLYEPVYVEEGTKFQLAVQEKGELLYLYSEGEKVLKTANPDSVGVARTIWESVQGISPKSVDYAYAFAIQNTDTEAVLVYDGDFHGTWSKSVIAGWRLFASPLNIYPPQYKLRYVPYSSNGFIPGIYYYQPLLKHNSHSSSLGRGDDDLYEPVYVEEGTKFQLAVQEKGELLYLYSEGEKVLKTANPDSVGVARTIWESVQGRSPKSVDYAYTFAIQNTDTEAVLVYDGDFHGTWSKSVIAGWRLFASPLNIYPPQYKLRYVPYSSNGFIPGIYYYHPIGEGDVVVLKTVA